MQDNLKPFRQELTYVIDLDERGIFRAHVENSSGTTVFEFDNEDEERTGALWLVEDGFMRHSHDTDGLHSYLIDMGIAQPLSTLTLMH